MLHLRHITSDRVTNRDKRKYIMKIMRLKIVERYIFQGVALAILDGGVSGPYLEILTKLYDLFMPNRRPEVHTSHSRLHPLGLEPLPTKIY